MDTHTASHYYHTLSLSSHQTNIYNYRLVYISYTEYLTTTHFLIYIFDLIKVSFTPLLHIYKYLSYC